jgi:subfamily B ATP-binding cassette protein MsbA
MSRITFDVNYIQGAVSEAITSLLKDSFTILCLVFVVFWRDWKLAIIAMVVFPLTVYPISRFGKKIRKAVTGAQITMGSLTSLLQETITGARIVKAFSMEDYENKRFAKESENLLKLFMKAVSVNALSSPLMEFLGGIGIASSSFTADGR